MAHFSYTHLPAQGLGHRDPRRPHVTGGIGLGLPVFIVEVLEQRLYRDLDRRTLIADRGLLVSARSMILVNREFLTGARSMERAARILSDIDMTLSAISRSMSPEERSTRSIDRRLN